jgi:hypothetical protein
VQLRASTNPGSTGIIMFVHHAYSAVETLAAEPQMPVCNLAPASSPRPIGPCCCVAPERRFRTSHYRQPNIDCGAVLTIASAALLRVQ